jgi:transcriptional regulator with XRE-family HTH domain
LNTKMINSKADVSSRNGKVDQLGDVLRDIRLSVGITQVGLAEQAGVAENTIHLVEKGVRGLHETTLTKIANVLGVPASVLRLLADKSNDPAVKQLQKMAKSLVAKQLEVRK